MDLVLKDRIIEMLRSGDDELKELACSLFCSSKRSYMDWYRIAKDLAIPEYQANKYYLVKMIKCTK